MNPTVLILGANGRFGAAAARAFADAGWSVVAQLRRPTDFGHPRIRAVSIPLQDTAALAAAAHGARAVVHAINPPYTRWAQEVLPLGRLGMDVAERLGATFMLPGNVYHFGEQMPAVLSADTLPRPSTRKGHVRAALEAEMRERPRLRSVVIRAGDFYGCGAGSWFDQVIVKSIASGKLVYPGPLDVPHAWAYVPDLARAFVAVAQARLPRRFNDLPFAGHTFTGTELLDAIDAAHGSGLRRGRLPWALIRAGGLFVPMWRELAEMSYLWTRPHALDGRALADLVGPRPATPPARAIGAALNALAAPAHRTPVSPLSA